MNDYLETKLKTINTRKQQYNILLECAEKYRPEWYLKIIIDNDLDEFHHILWELPFYKRMFKVDNPTFLNRVTTYIQPTDQSRYYVELYNFKVFKYRKNILKGSYSVEQEIVTHQEQPELFEKYTKVMMVEQTIQPGELPKPIAINSI